MGDGSCGWDGQAHSLRPEGSQCSCSRNAEQSPGLVKQSGRRHSLKDHLGDKVVMTEQCIPGRMNLRALPRMTPRFLDRTVARQQSESQKGVGKACDTISLTVVIKSMFARGKV